MCFTKKEIEKIFIEEIKDLYDVQINNVNENLLNPQIGIPEADFIYLFENLRENYNIDIYPVIAKNTYEIFTINCLVEKLIDKPGE